jgi:hypothetical protein
VSDLFDDGVGAGNPDEWLRVIFDEVSVDGGLDIDDAFEVVIVEMQHFRLIARGAWIIFDTTGNNAARSIV